MVRVDPARRRPGVLDGGRDRGARGPAGSRPPPRCTRLTAASRRHERVVGVQVPGHPAPAVEVDDGRRALGRGGADARAEPPVDPDRDVRRPRPVRGSAAPSRGRRCGPAWPAGHAVARTRMATGSGTAAGSPVGGAVGQVDQGQQGLDAPVEHPAVTLDRRRVPRTASTARDGRTARSAAGRPRASARGPWIRRLYRARLRDRPRGDGPTGPPRGRRPRPAAGHEPAFAVPLPGRGPCGRGLGGCGLGGRLALVAPGPGRALRSSGRARPRSTRRSVASSMPPWCRAGGRWQARGRQGSRRLRAAPT